MWLQIQEWLSEARADNVIHIDVSDGCTFAEDFILATGRSERHVFTTASGIAWRVSFIPELSISETFQWRGFCLDYYKTRIIHHVHQRTPYKSFIRACMVLTCSEQLLNQLSLFLNPEFLAEMVSLCFSDCSAIGSRSLCAFNFWDSVVMLCFT